MKVLYFYETNKQFLIKVQSTFFNDFYFYRQNQKYIEMLMQFTAYFHTIYIGHIYALLK